MNYEFSQAHKKRLFKLYDDKVGKVIVDARHEISSGEVDWNSLKTRLNDQTREVSDELEDWEGTRDRDCGQGMEAEAKNTKILSKRIFSNYLLAETAPK